MNRKLTLVALAIFVASLWLYVDTAIPGMIAAGGPTGDSAELQRVAYRLGVPHSTGYPIFAMVGYAFAQIGESLNQNPYTWVTFASALWGAAGITLFAVLLMRILNPVAVVFAAGLLATSDTYWHISTITEVQSLNALAVIAVLGFAIRWLNRPNQHRALIGVAIFAGVGLANHRMILLILPAVALAMLLRGLLRRLTVRQMALLVIIAVIPLLSYTYIYVRMDDPFVVHSTRPSWMPSNYTTQTATDLILGTHQGGQGTFDTLQFPTDDFTDRLRFLWDRVQVELPSVAVLLGAVGLILMLRWRWQAALMLGFSALIWSLFLMSWRLDAKSVIYYAPITLILVIGLAFLASPQLYWKRVSDHRLIMVLLALPIFALAVSAYIDNRPVRDQSADRTGIVAYDQMQHVPFGALVWNFRWSPETFILLEYLETAQRRDVTIRESDLWWVPLDDMRINLVPVLIGPTMRGIYGLYEGQTWFQVDQGIAFAGTAAPIFLRGYAQGDDPFREEADAATPADHALNDVVSLHSFDYRQRDDGIHLTLYWTASEPVEQPLSVFTHLRGYESLCDPASAQILLSQQDAFAPVAGSYPTTLWTPGTIIRDTYLIPWPDAPFDPSTTAVTVGMTTPTGDRLAEFCVPLADVPSS